MGRVPHKAYNTQAREASLHELVTRLGLPMKQVDILHVAFTHTSYANEHKSLKLHHNQRLEFLGDAVLDLIIGEHLFHNHRDMDEGQLTKVKAATVCEESLAIAARKLNLGHYLLMGHGEATSGGRDRDSILADTFECLIGAIYETCSYQEARNFALKQLARNLEQALEGKRGKDYKTLLQELVQQDGPLHIEYQLLAESGPDHAKTFTIVVVIDGKTYETGTGKSKKIAQQNAAKATLAVLSAHT